MNTNLYPSFSVFIVDDEERILRSLSGILKSGGINNIICTKESSDVLDTLSKQDIGALLLDLTMPNLTGEELLPLIHLDYPDLPIIIVTGTADLATVVECMKMGAFDYLVKPIETRKLIATVKRAVELQELRQENEALQRNILANELEYPEAFLEIITGNDKIRSILLYVEAIARTVQPVLITGETGVGKELVACAIHKSSGRQGEYTPINVAGFDDNMFADALFGHKKGAFTGAEQTRKGMIERASFGTLFLDEIGDLSHTSQVKLLRLLEASEYFPLGSDVAKRSKARIVVATNKDLKKGIETGTFRRDLFYRLRTHHVHLPPLREHMDDLDLLTEHFLVQAAQELGKKKPTLPPELVTLLGTYHFPGNIRELKSMIFDAVSEHKSGTLSMKTFKKALGWENIPITESRRKPLITFSEEVPTIKQAIDLLIDEVMERSKGNQAIAAGLLGISPQALGKRLKKLKQQNT